MLTNANINTLFLDLFPLFVALCAWLYQWIIQRFPEKQRASLEQFARIATNKIEQVFPDAGSANKKQLATSLVEDLFKAFRLPIPDPRAIDAAIESAVLVINQAQITGVETPGSGNAPSSSSSVSTNSQA